MRNFVFARSFFACSVSACFATASAASAVSAADVGISLPGATSTPPPPGPATTAVFPTPTQTTLPNGLRVIAVRMGNVPLVTAQLLSKRGSASDAREKPGIAALAAKVMLEGTATRGARAIAIATDVLGAHLTATPGSDSTGVSVDATTDKFAAALGLLADVVRNPTFAPGEVERARKQTLAALLQTYANTERLADIAVARALYGNETYGNPLDGTPASVAAIGRDDLVAFAREAFRPDLSILVIGGDMDPQRAFDLARSAFGTWSSPPSPALGTAPAIVTSSPRFIVIDKPDAGAGVVAAGVRTVSRASARYAAADMANAVLTGYSGRLNAEVRVKRGLAYGAVSTFSAHDTDGSLIARTLSVENAKIPEATDVVLSTLRDFAAAPVMQGELDARRLATLGNRAYALQTQLGVVGSFATYARYGLPLDTINTEAASALAITPAIVRAFSQRYITQPTVVVIGNAAAFLGGLRAHHTNVEIVPFDRLDLRSATLTRTLEKP